MKNALTLRYTLQQCAYWAAAAGVVSFATAFLLEKGFAAARIGILLASGNFLGGQLLDAFDVRMLLFAGVAMAVSGTLVFFCTVDKKDGAVPRK